MEEQEEIYETPQLVLLGNAETLVKGELVPDCGDATACWWC
ncbi:MAG TPA: hypothetical protein VGN37_14920 [Actinocatenispora sp.]